MAALLKTRIKDSLNQVAIINKLESFTLVKFI